MNSPVFLQFELGRAKAQLAAFFAVMPGLLYFPRKNGHVILGFFALLSKESGDSVPRTPWDFSLWTCSGGDRPWAGGLPVGGRTPRFQGCIGARGASPQLSILRCNIDSLG